MELIFLLCCESVLDFSVLDYQYYNSLGLSVLDATFSTTAKYGAVENVLIRFWDQYGLSNETFSALPAVEVQTTVSQIMEQVQDITPAQFAEQVQNRSRVGGRLKAALFLDCLAVMHEFGIETYQDFQARMDNPELEAALSALRGMGEVTLSYLYMLSGDSGNVKVDRHIRAFATAATGVPDLTLDQIRHLFQHAAREMSANDHPRITVRHLDHIVWVYQSRF